MKLAKKLFAVLLSAALALMVAVPAFAVNETNGSITINNATQGQTYAAYKVFDVVENDGDYYYYASAAVAAKLTGATCPFSVSTTASNNGLYAVTLKDATTADVSAWIKDNIIEIDTPVLAAPKTGTADSSGTVKITVGEYGFYYVTSTLGSLVMVDKATPTATINDKNVDWTDPVSGGFKYVLNSADEELHTTTANVGDPVKFVIGFIARNFGKNAAGEYELVKEYKVVDTPDGLDIDPDKITVKITYDDVPGASTSSTAVENVPHTASVNEETGEITITIPWAEDKNANDEDATDEDWVSLYDAPARVVINYSGTLTKTTATNEAGISTTLVEGDKIKHDPTPGEDLEDDIYAYTVQVNKVDGNDATATLKDAKFKLTRETPVLDEDGEKTTDEDGKVITTTEYYKVDTTGKVTWGNETDATVVTTDAQGLASFVGVEAGTYYLVETEAPAGYNLLTEPKEFTLAEIDAELTDTSVLTVPVTVENFSGSTLPETGGMGTTIFYVLGGVLVVGAGILLVTKKRMNGEA